MGLLRRIADRLDPRPQTRAADPSWAALSDGAGDWSNALFQSGAILKGGGLGDALRLSRPRVTPPMAELVSTVLACVNAIAGATSSLPVWIYRLKDQGREVDPNHAVARIVRDGANEHQSWPEFIEWLVASTLLNGNALAEIVAGPSGRVAALKPIAWNNVSVILLASGRLAYDVTPVSTLNGQTGKSRRLLDSEVLHLRDRSDDGLVGRSRLARTAPPVRTGLTQESFGEYLYGNRATPSGVLSFDHPLSMNQRGEVQEGLQSAWQGVRNSGKILVLDGAAKFTPVTVTPENLEMLAARRFSTEEIARMYGVPPPIVGIWDHSTFTNSETAGRWFAQFCLAPWIRKIEEAFRRSVFSAATRATHELEFDMSGFLRGDAEARWKAHEIAVKNRILTPNEVREVEGWNPRPELDDPPPPEPGIA